MALLWLAAAAAVVAPPLLAALDEEGSVGDWGGGVGLVALHLGGGGDAEKAMGIWGKWGEGRG